MVEYGGAIEKGPVGQVSGGGGGNPIVGGGGSTDLLAPVVRFVDDAIQTLTAMSPTELILVALAIFGGLLILRRAL